MSAWQDIARLSTTASILVTVAGVIVILAALRDIFDALFHPGGRATLSRGLMRVLWAAFRPLVRRRAEVASIAGPSILIAAIAWWALALIVGWALVYWAHMPQGFEFESGARHGGLNGLIDATYLSIVTLTTLGFGDVTPDAAVLRIVAPFEALLGFGLLTTSLSLLGSIYPAVQRHRSLAYEVYLLREAQVEAQTDVGALDAGAAAAVYGDLVSRVIAAERDLVAYPFAYYFDQTDDRFALSAAMPYMWDLALEGADDANDDRARLRALMLRDAISDFARTAALRFHRDTSDDTRHLLVAYARDHVRRPEQAVDTP